MKPSQDTLDRIESIKTMVNTEPEESLLTALLQISCMRLVNDDEEFLYLCDKALEIIGNKMEEVAIDSLISATR